MLAEDRVTNNVFARMTISVPEMAQRTATTEEIEAMLDHARRRSHQGAVARGQVRWGMMCSLGR